MNYEGLSEDEDMRRSMPKQKALLLDEMSDDDQYLRKGGNFFGGQGSWGGMGGNGLLIQGGGQEPAQEMGRKGNLARQISDSKKAAASTWKKGDPYSESVRRMFDPSGETSTPAEQVRAMRFGPNRGGFQYLFGNKKTQARRDALEAMGRTPKKTFWGRLKDSLLGRQNPDTGERRKRTWMEMFFGAQKKPRRDVYGQDRGDATSMDMRHLNTKAKNGVSSGWADRLVDEYEGGDLPRVRQSDEFMNGAEKNEERITQPYVPSQRSQEQNRGLIVRQSLDEQRNSYGNADGTEDDKSSVKDDDQSEGGRNNYFHQYLMNQVFRMGEQDLMDSEELKEE